VRLISLAVFLCFFLLAPLAWANPPVSIDVVYDASTQAVLISIVHPVGDLGTHYIFKVEVSVNGKSAKEETLDRQQDLLQQKVRYVIPGIKSKDVISVKAFCNVSGSLAASYQVE